MTDAQYIGKTRSPRMSSRRVHLEARLSPGVAGRRLDQALAETFPEHSRTRLKAWIEGGQATVDGRAGRPRDTVLGGEWVRIEAEVAEEVPLRPQAIALDLVYEDAQLIVVAKPPGLVVHPGAGNPDRTLQNALLAHDPSLAALPRAGLVHRLDKDTSGLLVVARTLEAHTALVRALEARDIHREYEAVVHGVLTGGGTVDAPIGRHATDRLRMAIREDGRPAVTHYRLLERFRAHTHLRVILETGRTHQIRVHLAHAGYPIVGDPVYGRRLAIPRGATAGLAEALRGFRRQALHAARLEFEHPVTGRPLAFEAPLPADLAGLLEALREDAASVTGRDPRG
jgi:23S rRNA pseudouridine1911/1915/1917 synthase